MIKYKLLPVSIFTLLVLLLAAGCFPPAAPGTTSQSQPSISNGKNIYINGMSDSNQPITYQGVQGYIQYGAFTCSTCHGPEGHGRQYFQLDTNIYTVPDITWPVLMKQDPPYTEDTLKRAITQGIGASGKQLTYPMSGWNMSASDLNDLVSFIKTLK